MSIWSAPDVMYLLDDHLKRARLELLSDARLRVNVEDDGGEDPGFVAELIVDKLEAAALAGFDAVEASLRASASEHLAAKGMGVLQARAALLNACQRIVPPKRPRLEKVGHGAVPPALVGGIIASAGLVIAFLLWELNVVGSVTYIVLLLASLGVGFALVRLLGRGTSKRRTQLIDDWPARVCRHYADALHEGIAYYEHVVRTAARGGTLIPWR